MKNKKAIAGLVLVLGLVICLTVGFFSNSKREVDLSIAAPVMRTYAVEKYDLNVFTQVSHNNQRKTIKIDIIKNGEYDLLLAIDEEKFKDYMEDLCNMSLDIKKEANKFLDRNDIKISIRVLNDQNMGDTYLIEVINGKVEFNFRDRAE